jgi:hypothetical protein
LSRIPVLNLKPARLEEQGRLLKKAGVEGVSIIDEVFKMLKSERQGK